jgi:hypothetical protein
MKVEQDADAVRASVRNAARAYRGAGWELGRALYAALHGVGRDGRPLWTAWGYRYEYEYLRAEVFPDVHPATVRASVHVYRTYGLNITSRRTREAASQLPFRTLHAAYRVVTQENAESWIRFMETHSYADVQAAAKVAAKKAKGGSKAMAVDPELAHVRATRLKEIKPAKIASRRLSIALSAEKRAKVALITAIARRVVKNDALSPEASIFLCLEQFERLVRSGRAGAGWSLDAVEIAS